MKNLADLYVMLDLSSGTNEKLAHLESYFSTAAPEDAIWTVALLTGRRPRRPVTTTALRNLAAQKAGIPLWLFEESYHVVGDLAETISLLVTGSGPFKEVSLSQMMSDLKQLNSMEEAERLSWVLLQWDALPSSQLFIFNKLITGSFRVGVSKQLVTKALARVHGMENDEMAHRLMGNWDPSSDSLKTLISPDPSFQTSRPYPFYLAYQLDVPLEELGAVEIWQFERKYDGIRGQIVFRNGQVNVWSRGEELMNEQFVEFQALATHLQDGTVLDGEVLPFKDGRVMSFSEMQKRIGKKKAGKGLLQDVPLCMFCYDLLEHQGTDIRTRPLRQRRFLLEQTLMQAESPLLKLSPLLNASSWSDVPALREESKKHGCEGLMLKKLESVYETGRRRGSWWKWKVDPYSVDAVLIYAQSGHGRRANLLTDYTFAVWDNDVLVPFAKAYSGLTDQEILQLDQWLRRHTIEKFGPVRSVKAEQVFELGFEGIARSSRHKSGIAVRFPRILRWRTDKKADEANSLADLQQLIDMSESEAHGS